ncbi:MAG TPA: hypothetical protein PK600_08910 [Deltaproteobacteria bacterium]|nr:hypothetical protein [Deltaproteobacteria bacterium]
MALGELKTSQLDIERAKIRVFSLLTRCIRDIEETVTTFGITMRDVGVGVEKYMADGNSYIIEVKLHL